MEQGASDPVSLIRAHLQSKNDTERFVGLKLLLSIFQNQPQVRDDKHQIEAIWQSIPTKFIDRLLKTGCNPQAENGRECLTLVVAVLHAFSLLIPRAGKDDKFTLRIPKLVPALLNSSPETTELTLQLLLTLVSEPQGAKELIQIEDLSPLTEAAPSNRLALDVLRYSWLSSMHGGAFDQVDAERMNKTISGLIVSFSDTDAVTLLDFLGDFLREADRAALPLSPPVWVSRAVACIHSLASKRPAAEAREAYTNAVDSILKTWPVEGSAMLFSSKSQQEQQKDKHPQQLLIKLIMVDVRASLPVLLGEQERSSGGELSSAGTALSRRLSWVFDIISQLIGFLIRISESEETVSDFISFDHLMSLQKSLSETLEISVEFLFDRYGNLGHAETHSIADPLTLAILRALSLWLRENEDAKVRRAAGSLVGVLTSCYRESLEGPWSEECPPSPKEIDFRSPCLMILLAIFDDLDDAALFSENNELNLLLEDLIFIGKSFIANNAHDRTRWPDLVELLKKTRVKMSRAIDSYLDRLTEASLGFSQKLRSTAVVPHQDDEVRDYEVAVFQLVCDTLSESWDQNPSEHLKALHVGLAEKLYTQIVVIDEDTPGTSELKDSVQALMQRLAKRKNAAFYDAQV